MHVKSNLIGNWVSMGITGSEMPAISSDLCATPPEQYARQFVANVYIPVTYSIHLT